MVLEPTGAMGSFVGECAIDVSTGTCAPGVHDDDQSSLVSVILFGWCTAITILLATAVWLGIRSIRAIEADAGHLALQVARADTTLGEHMVAIPDVQRSMGQMRNQVTENASDMIGFTMVWWRLEDLPSTVTTSAKASHVRCGAG